MADRGGDLQVVKREHAASGLITCGDAHGAGQLTEASDVVTTAAHVLFDEEGNPRAASCFFSVVLDGKADPHVQSIFRRSSPAARNPIPCRPCMTGPSSSSSDRSMA